MYDVLMYNTYSYAFYHISIIINVNVKLECVMPCAIYCYLLTFCYIGCMYHHRNTLFSVLFILTTTVLSTYGFLF